MDTENKKKHKKLGELASTAISGNDISSSVLYVSALAIAFAGQYAWITLLFVVVILFLFRKIYGEVVGALPLNGGAYNALLNTTSKSTASIAATLTLLSYMATAVISANEAIHYLHHLVSIPVIISTIVLLGFFAILTIIGISESAVVAIVIFIFHLFSLVLLAGAIIIYLINNGFSLFIENWNQPLNYDSIWKALFWGFAVSMLGISGFESSANFVEEQKKGVFPKTLRNMWIVVSIINPMMAFLAIALIPIADIKTKYQQTLLSQMGEMSAGHWLATIISFDAVFVLSGAVLTSYVGVTGLLERMTLDRILPQFLLKKNRRDSSYMIILLFFALSVSVLLISKGNVKLLAGVYAISFLFVMGLFTIGNILLKLRRSKLPRPEIAPIIFILIAFIGVSFALAGNIMMPSDEGMPSNIVIFLNYFIPAMILVLIMLNRIFLLKILLKSFKSFFDPIRNFAQKLDKKILDTITDINSQEFVFFTKNEDVSLLNEVMLYIKKNEHTKALKLVSILDENQKISEKWIRDVDVLNREYPEIEIEIISRVGEFNPKTIKELSKEWNIPINFMFIGSPSSKFKYRVEELGGVRLII